MGADCVQGLRVCPVLRKCSVKGTKGLPAGPQRAGKSFGSVSHSGSDCQLNLNIISSEFIIKNSRLERRQVSYTFEFAPLSRS